MKGHSGVPADLAAALCAAAMIAQQTGGKATRDALFLSRFAVTDLPTMFIVAAVASLLAVPLLSRALRGLGPARLVPPAFAGSALLLLGEWWLVVHVPRWGAVAVYLHLSVLGLALVSGFWSLVNETFDPRTAKRTVGRLAAAGTAGGIVGGLLAERVAALSSVSAMLPILAALHLACAAAARHVRPAGAAPAPGPPASDAPSGWAVVATQPYLRRLALLVLVGTVAAALLDYVFKVRAAAAFPQAEDQLRFFALFYTAVALATFLLQASLARPALERLGLGRTVATLPLATAAGGACALLAPGLGGAVIARVAEASLRNSLFRAGYELLYTPLRREEKRAAKPVIDVGLERLGDAVGGGIIGAVLVTLPQAAPSVLLVLAILLAGAGLLIARPLDRGYVRALARSLRERAVELDLSVIGDSTTRHTFLHTMGSLVAPFLAAPPTPPPGGPDPLVSRIQGLRSGDPARIRTALAEGPLGAAVVPHAIPLLARPDLARETAAALAVAAAQAPGQLVDALLDAAQPLDVRLRIPALLASTTSPVAVEGLFQGLGQDRLELRVQCGRALSRLRRRADVRLDGDRVFAAVKREAAVDATLWEAHLLEPMEEDSPLVEGLVRQRTDRSLEHVFTLLALVLPEEPLRIAFRGLHTNDPLLRGTALEYLDGVLPPDIREGLRPFLDDPGATGGPRRAREDVLADLMRANESIRLNLEALRK